MGGRVSDEELAVRRAVRSALTAIDSARPVLVACSGGADSLALAAAVAHVAARDGRPAGGVSVDHGIQDGSAARARSVASILTELGLDPVEVIHVPVRPGRLGPEGNARVARYAALDATAARHGDAAVLLGHTRDDQAETVLLGLARGSGARSLGGMPTVAGRYLRPLLGLDRGTVRAAVPGDIKPWEDPHNADPAYARARVRHRLLPALEAELGPGIAEALSRSAALLRADADALDGWAARAMREALREPEVLSETSRSGSREPARVALDVGILATLPDAVRWRVLRRAAIQAGSPPTDLTAAHVLGLDRLVTSWRGQRSIDLPGPVQATRSGSTLSFGRATRAE